MASIFHSRVTKVQCTWEPTCKTPLSISSSTKQRRTWDVIWAIAKRKIMVPKCKLYNSPDTSVSKLSRQTRQIVSSTTQQNRRSIPERAESNRTWSLLCDSPRKCLLKQGARQQLAASLTSGKSTIMAQRMMRKIRRNTNILKQTWQSKRSPA